MLVAAWNSNLAGPLTASAAGFLAAAGTGAGAGTGASPPLYSARHVCMSFVTVLSPDVMAPPLLRAANRSALPAGAATAATAAAAAAAAFGAGADNFEASNDAASAPCGFHATPVVWCSFTYAMSSMRSVLNVSQNAIWSGLVVRYSFRMLLAQ